MFLTPAKLHAKRIETHPGAAAPTCHPSALEATLTERIEIEPPSTPSTGKLMASFCWRAPITYNSGR